jgi:hypothetical protein
VGVVGQHAHPAVSPLVLGPLTRERACRVLEQQLGAVWAAVLESHGLDPGDAWRVSLEGLAVVPEPGMGHGPPESTSNGRPADAVG